MLYVDAIRVLEKVARARFDLASMPKKEEIEEQFRLWQAW